MQAVIGLIKRYYFGFILLLVGLHVNFFQIYGYDLKYIIGDMGDARFIASLVEYNYQWLIGNYGHYWDGFFMFPDNEVMSYSDNLLGSLPFYAVLRAIGIPFLTAYQLLMLLFHGLNFICAYLFFNKVTRNKYAASAGAFVFAFSIVLCGVFNHPQFIFRFCIPLFFYFLHNYLMEKEFKQLVYAALFLIFQFYLGVYIGYFLLFFAALYFISHHGFYTRKADFREIRKELIHVLGAVFVFAAGVMPMFYFYFKRAQTNGYFSNYKNMSETIPRLSSYLRSFPEAFSWKFLNDTDVDTRYIYFHFLFPGALVFLSVIYSLYLSIRGVNRKFYLSILALLFIFVLLTTLVGGNSLFKYLYESLPGFKIIRILSRIVLVAVFFAAWLISQNVTDLLKKQVKISYVLVVLLPIILVLDNYVPAAPFRKTAKQESLDRMQAIETKLQQGEKGKRYEAFAYIPDSLEESFIVQIDAMLTAVDLKTKTINGYSSACNDNFWPVWTRHDSTSVVNWCKVMQLDPSKVRLVK